MSPRRLLPLLAFALLHAPRLPAAPVPTLSAQVEMRDGHFLTADVFLPSSEGPFPVSMERSPYPRSAKYSMATTRTAEGFAFVVTDLRGGVVDTGEYVPFLDDGWGERQDGFDMIAWAASQEWCNGQIMLEGSSGSAIAALLAAGSEPPALAGILCDTGSADIYSDIAFPGGVFQRSVIQDFLTEISNLESVAVVAQHARRDAFWDPVDITMRTGQVNVPTFQVAGWFDMYVDGTLETIAALDESGGPEARGRQLMIVGPYTHQRLFNQIQGELTFPPNVLFSDEFRLLIDRFRLEIIEGLAPDVFDRPTFTYYVMGDVDRPGAPGNEWRTSDVWPPPHLEVPLYFHGQGRLRTVPPVTPGQTSYESDPSTPLPTIGGNNLFEPSGPRDQRPLLGRPDILAFRTGALPASPFEIVGPMEARLFISSTAPDVDLMVKVCDVYPDGRVMLMREGVRQARRREGFDQESLMVSGEIYEVRFDIGHLALALDASHELMVLISSTNSPRWEINPQTGAPFQINDPVRQTATVTLHHSTGHPSQIILPVTPYEDAPGPTGLFTE